MEKDDPKTISWDFLTAKRPDILGATKEEIVEYIQQSQPYLNVEKQQKAIDRWLGFQKRLRKPANNNSGGFGI